MKIHAEERTVTSTVQPLAAGQFSIDVTPKAFTALSTYIYKNRPLAIIRELLCNSRDSHVMAGHSNPIDLQLPTTLSPYLVIRDYGVGMTPEFFTQTYCAFFRTDKDHTDSLIGGFGIGGKVYFSYTDQVTITSFKDGMKHVYAVFKGQDGMPGFNLVISEPTEEPTGVSVSIPIKPEDFNKFENAARQVIRYLDMDVNTFGVIPQKAADYVFEMTLDNGWRVGFLPEREHRGVRIVQAGIGYEVTAKVSSDVRAVQSADIDIHIPAGTFPVTLSRDSLETTPSLNQAMEVAYTEIKNRYFVAVQEAIDKIALYFDAIKMAGRANSLSTWSCWSEMNRLTWKGVRIDRTYNSSTDPATMAPFNPIGLTIYTGTRRGITLKEKGLYRRKRPVAVYWSEKKLSGTQYWRDQGLNQDDWVIHLTGPRAESFRFFKWLGIKESEVLDAAEMRTRPTTRSSSPNLPRICIRSAYGNENTRLLEKDDTFEDVLKYDYRTQQTIEKLQTIGALKTPLRTIEVETQKPRGEKWLDKSGWHTDGLWTFFIRNPHTVDLSRIEEELARLQAAAEIAINYEIKLVAKEWAPYLGTIGKFGLSVMKEVTPMLDGTYYLTSNDAPIDRSRVEQLRKQYVKRRRALISAVEKWSSRNPEIYDFIQAFGMPRGAGLKLVLLALRK